MGAGEHLAFDRGEARFFEPGAHLVPSGEICHRLGQIPVGPSVTEEAPDERNHPIEIDVVAPSQHSVVRFGGVEL